MTWTVHPAKEKMRRTLLSTAFILCFLIFVSIFYGMLWGILGLAFLVVSLHSYYFPTSYSITPDEVIIKTVFATNKRKLSEFKKVYYGKNGILLSPFKHKTFLNNFRGVFLLLPQHRDEILKYMIERVEPVVAPAAQEKK
jgi:hypothetical protein